MKTEDKHHRRRRRWLFVSLLLIVFLFRLGFGLSSEFWSADELQTYLIGLKFFSSGAWPYFGPDVAYQIQVPGALQGLVVGLPLYILPLVEAPFIVLNALSFGSLCLLAWYCVKRLPEIPAWLIWTWLMTAPWTLNFSTHIVNPSYVLPGSILFFIGALELCPLTSKGLIRPHWAGLMMGLALSWVMQFHLSWVLLVPYTLVAFCFQYTSGDRARLWRSVTWFAGGAALTGLFLLPTYIKYGFSHGAGGTNQTIALNAGNIRKVLSPAEGILPRFLSLASFEIPRFIGNNSANRWIFLKEEWWLAPVTLFLVVIGILQPIAMIVLWFTKRPSQKDWAAIKWLALGSVLLLCVSFLFSIKSPASHTFYVLFPIAMIYSLYCWSRYLRKRAWQKFAAICLAGGVVFHAGLAAHNFSRHSLYVDRNVPQTAIRSKDPGVLGQRRPGSLY